MAGMLGISDSGLRSKLHVMYRKLRVAGYEVDNLASLVVWSYDPEVLRSRAA